MLEHSRIVDLSVTVAADLPSAWPFHMPFSTKVWNYYADLDERQGRITSYAPYQTRYWIIDEHTGTHFDAPPHFIPPSDSGLPWAGDLGNQTGDRVPLEDLCGPAVCLDMSFLAEGEQAGGISPWITVEHIAAWEQEHGEITPGSAVLLRTGWNRFYVRGHEGQRYASGPLVFQSTPGWPAPTADAVIHLYNKGVRCLGIDAPSIGAAHDGVPAHQEGLSRGMRYVEMLTDLHRLPATGAWFIFLPVKVEGSTGGPGRAVAFLAT